MAPLGCSAGLRSARMEMGAANAGKGCERRKFLQTTLVNAGFTLAGFASKVGAEQTARSEDKKLIDISDEEFKSKLREDVVKNQFMVTGALTRSLYDEKCTFTDEIDTYTLEKWMDGTAKLFQNDYSKMELDGDIQVNKDGATFKFKEQLMFNIPILKPKVPLTGKLILTRGSDGLITSYREVWDQPVWKVLTSASFF